MYSVTKTYGHDRGLSACFRQHRAVHSHCSLLHGYALSFSFRFEARELDKRNWVVDFGALDPLKDWLVEMFDHKLLIAADDPDRVTLLTLKAVGVADVRILDRGVGCERFAELALSQANEVLAQLNVYGRVRCVECTVAEHGANSASAFVGEGKVHG